MDGSDPGRTTSALILHIGPRKTGTTAIQHVFSTQRDALRAHGVVYPGSVRQHFMAVNRFIGRRQLWEEDHKRPVSEQPWRDLIDEMADAPFGVISTEVLSQSRTGHIERLVASASGRKPVVVITYRPFDQLLSSTWQQMVKEGLREPLDQWARRVVTERPETTDAPFPRVLDVHALVQTWGDVVGLENINVVVVDRARPNLIFEAFEEILQLPAGFLSSQQGEGSKRSLSAEEAELLRQVNQRLSRDKNSLKQHRHLLRTVAAWLNTHDLNPHDSRIVLPADVVAAAHVRTREMMNALASVKDRITVYGSLDSLVASDSPSADRDESSTPQPESVRQTLAADWLSGIIGHLPTVEA